MSKFNYYSRGADFEGAAGGMDPPRPTPMRKAIIKFNIPMDGTVYLPNGEIGRVTHRGPDGRPLVTYVEEQLPGVYGVSMRRNQPAQQNPIPDVDGTAGGMQNGGTAERMQNWDMRQSVIEARIPHIAQVFLPGGSQQGTYTTYGPNGQVREHEIRSFGGPFVERRYF